MSSNERQTEFAKILTDSIPDTGVMREEEEKDYLKAVRDLELVVRNALKRGQKDGKLADRINEFIQSNEYDPGLLFNYLEENHVRLNCSYLLGIFNEHGIGTSVNQARAVEVYQIGAEYDELLGHYYLSLCYYYGRGVEKDANKDFYHSTKSAEAGCGPGQCSLGFCFEEGIGVKKDERLAVHWYTVSAMKGYTVAQNNLARSYRHGLGVTKDEAAAFEWYEKSANGGNVIGMFFLGYCYEFRIGVEQDVSKAVYWYQKSAEGGDCSAMYNVGNCYYSGRGVQENKEKAFYWYSLASKAGDTSAMCNLGYCYLNGIGCDLDEKKAFEWYEKSAKGDGDGQSMLAFCYLNGKGVRADPRKAFVLFEEAALKGSQFAQNRLGCCYIYRWGTDKDLHKAIKWLKIGKEKGDKEMSIEAKGQLETLFESAESFYSSQ